MKQPELIETLGSLVEKDFDKWLKVKLGLCLKENSDPCSQEYFWGDKNRLITDDDIKIIFDAFQDNYAKYGIGIAISHSFMMIGLAHLTEAQRKFAINELMNKG